MIDDSALAAAFAKANLPGAVALLTDRDGVTYSRVFGQADAVGGASLAEDSVFQIASMTKAVTSAGAMQLVEQGRLSLDAPIGPVLPDLANPQVLIGFDSAGQPQLRPAARPITLRHLLTHTAGFGYFFIREELLQYFAAVGTPDRSSLDSIRLPLLFDPGENWEYSIATDWVGQAVEAVTGQRLGDHLTEHLLAPLGMTQTAFRDVLPEGAARVHERLPGGGFQLSEAYLGGGQFDMGGGGLTSTAPDYSRFVRMILRGGELNGVRVLKPETVAELTREQVAPLRAGYMGTAMPELASVYDTFPDQHTGWTLGFLTNPEPGPNGRAPGSLAWAGIFNSYYWIDPASGLGGVLMSQLAPFGDAGALGLFGALERMAYA